MRRRVGRSGTGDQSQHKSARSKSAPSPAHFLENGENHSELHLLLPPAAAQMKPATSKGILERVAPILRISEGLMPGDQSMAFRWYAQD